MHYYDLVINLVRRDLKLKYKGSAIGFFWSLVNPIITLVIYTIVFGTIMHSTILHFPLFLMSGMLPWNFFASTITMSVGGFTGNAGMITKVRIPKIVFILSSLLYNIVIFAMMIVIIIVSMPLFHVGYTWNLALLPIALLLQVLFSFGMSMIIATANVVFHDTAHLVEVIMMAWFWLTPVIYQASEMPHAFQMLIQFNPMSLIINLYQISVIGGKLVSSPVAGVIGIILVAGIGLLMYVKLNPKIAEWL